MTQLLVNILSSYLGFRGQFVFISLEDNLFTNSVISYYMCKIGEVRDYEIKEAYEKLCNEGILKDEFKVVERND